MLHVVLQEGSLIGFWYPPWAGSALNVPGFHLHLLSGDLLRGGHVLQCSLAQGGELWLQEVTSMHSCRHASNGSRPTYVPASLTVLYVRWTYAA